MLSKLSPLLNLLCICQYLKLLCEMLSICQCNNIKTEKDIKAALKKIINCT